ncbi:MAG: hypothetical protein HY237_15375 [Acidobacteria bacterium]|nr:hypothetical protein [Acidobacteriota bacterium]
MKRAAVLACVLLILPGALRAQHQDPAEKTREDRLAALEERVRALEDELGLLKEALKAARAQAGAGQAGGARLVLASAASPAAAPVSPAATPERQTVQVYGGAGGGAAKALNPDISVIGNFWGAASRNIVRPVPALEFHETEIAFQAIVDPFARADFFVSLGREGIELEEGYLTFTSLPGGVVSRVGKMRAAFGKVNAMHNDALPWIDRPLVAENLVAGEEGINDAGLSVTRILPAPKGVFLEATGQVYRGDSGDVFTATRRKDVSYVAHLRGYKDLSESTNIDLGFSYARGHNDAGSRFHTQLYGIDATLRWRPLRRAIYHSFLARAEMVWSNRDQLFGALLPETQRAFGFFTSAEYRLNRRWTVGGRYDRSERARQANLIDTGFSALLTYWPSEFSQIRGQYRFTRYAEGRDANELRFQFLFVLGAHGAHPF